jgi:hypothetical protein
LLYVLTPDVSDVDHGRADALLAAAEHEWDDVPVSRIGPETLAMCEPTQGDAVIFFNPPRADLGAEVEGVLEEAARNGAVLLPIAMDAEHRRPPGAAGDKQSFDVVDHLRRRELGEDQLAVIGVAFAREAMSMTMPTFVQSHLRIFLCHRRADGETSTALVDRALQARHEHVFRDLIDIQAGAEAQDKIDENLAGADVLAFLDTPTAGESWWIAHELATALGRNVPIVWVRIGSESDDRAKLAVEPAAEPHIFVRDGELSEDRAGEVADEILRVAVRLARQHGRASRQALRELKAWAAGAGAKIEVLDARQLIFQIRHPRAKGARSYPMRQATDIVQFFGRTPSDSDHRALEAFLTDRGMGPHEHECRAFDAAIMLDPTATGHRARGDWSVTEHPQRFLSSLAPRDVVENAAPPRLLLLGAFPAGDLARDQIAPAVHAVTTTWLRMGGMIICGGHPTFVPLLVEAASGVLGDVGRERLVVYWSEWFVAPAQVDDISGQATVILTARGASRDTSLTIMRTRMIQESQAAAVLAVGGRTDEDGLHTPGIDEEIRLARTQGLPVYLLGAPGGHATVLAARAAGQAVPWTMLGNALDSAGNELLMSTDEYEQAARIIWTATSES